MEKFISYTSVSSYSTLNRLTPKTRRIWIGFHGLGYLSRYFIKYFEGLDSAENFIIAPQAPSKYYQKQFKYVGACWLTRETTESDSQNIICYIHGIYRAEVGSSRKPLILFGYSQGVSVMLRWITAKRIKPDKVVIHSGAIPQELGVSDFSYMEKIPPVYLVYGDRDEYFDADRVAAETVLAGKLFGKSLRVLPFSGKHEVNPKIFDELLE